MSYLQYISDEKGKSSKGIWTPTVICKCGNMLDGDEPSVYVDECEQCEMIEHEEGNVVIIDSDDMMVCGYCGIEEVYMEDCDCSEEVVTYFEFKESVAEETMGNKDEYHRILDGGRC